jgi:hypothetical protein
MNEFYTKTAATEAFSASRQQAAKMERYLESASAMVAQHAELEAYIQSEGREYERRLLQAHLQLRAALEQRVEVGGADGVKRGYARPEQPRRLTTIFGSVWVIRLAYQREGVEGLHPQDALLNLPAELHSHGLRQLVAQAAARHSFEQTREVIVKATGIAIGNRQLEELAARASVDFEAFYAGRTLETENTEDLLVLSFDGKGIVMRHEDLRPTTRQAAEATSNKLTKRLSKGEKKNRKRMAEVAAVYGLPPVARTPDDILCDLSFLEGTAAQSRPRPKNKRVWASVKQPMKAVIEQAFEEALRRDPLRMRRWVALVDGNPEQLRLIKRAARRIGVQLTIVLDIIHVLDYIWDAAWCFYAQGSPEAECWVHRRLRGLLEGRSGGAIARSMRQLAKERGLNSKQRKPVDDCARYLVKHTRYLHYDQALADGLPLATGVIEGACRHLIKARMDAAQWSLDGAEGVLRLRALLMSGDFDEYWAFHLRRELQRNHLTHYAGRVIPMSLFPSKPFASVNKAA